MVGDSPPSTGQTVVVLYPRLKVFVGFPVETNSFI